jgi:vacuolar-type H+-ATPase subunit I/STV1
MSLNTVLPLVSTIISGVFAVVLLRRYAEKRRAHLLVWGIGLVIYGIGTFAEFYSTQAWSATIFRLWYLCGAVLAAAWLGQGTVHLLVRRRGVAVALLGVLVIGTLIAAVHVFSTPLNESIFDPRVPLSEQYATRSSQSIVGIMPEGGVRSYSFLFNIYGTVALVGGALYSGYLFWRKRVMPNRVLGNVFIALGGLSPALGGTLARVGTPEYLYLSELLGVIVIFVGFLLATRQQPVEAPAAQAV